MDSDAFSKEVERLAGARIKRRMDNILSNTRMTMLGGSATRLKVDQINAEKRKKMERAKNLLVALEAMGY